MQTKHILVLQQKYRIVGNRLAREGWKHYERLIQRRQPTSLNDARVYKHLLEAVGQRVIEMQHLRAHQRNCCIKRLESIRDLLYMRTDMSAKVRNEC